jgi:hypothetical protein
MQITKVSIVSTNSDQIKVLQLSLQALAKRQNLSVDEMVEAARDADSPTITQVRIINMADKLNTLEK